MRRFTVCLLVFCLAIAFCSCANTEKSVSCEDVIAAYEDAGYEVWHGEEAGADSAYYVKAIDPETEEYIYFLFFETADEAKEYADARQYNVLLWMFSVIYGHPSWLTTKTYQNIEIEYDHSYLYEPFRKLIRS